MSEPQVEPYRPFPPFSEFSATGFNQTSFDDFKAQMEEAKAATSPDALRSAFDQATRWAATDTGAIEGLYEVDRGFTMTVAAEAAAWANIPITKGEVVARAINDALEGYEYVLDLVTGRTPITEAWIRELHVVLCRSQEKFRVLTSQGEQEQALPKGQYKAQRNNPMRIATSIIHSYASVEDTPPEMQRLVAEMGSDDFQKAHPVLQAAYAHYAFVSVHPFSDGNGRVARALASIFLYRTPGVPLVVFADQKAEYLDALELADAGDHRGFVRFVGERASDTVRMVTAELRASLVSTTSQSRTEQLQSSLLGRGGLPHEHVDDLGKYLLRQFLEALGDAASANPPQPPISVIAHETGGASVSVSRPELRNIPNIPGIQLIAVYSSVAPARVTFSYGVFVAKPDFGDYDFLLTGNAGDLARFYVRDVNPYLTAAAAHILKSVARAQVAEIVGQISDSAFAALRNAGYV